MSKVTIQPSSYRVMFDVKPLAFDIDTGAAADVTGLQTSVAALTAQVGVITAAMTAANLFPKVGAWEFRDHMPTLPGTTTVLPAGLEYKVADLTQPDTTLRGAGMRVTLFDGQGGVDKGHRLAWGKGFFHVSTGPATIKDVGFIDTLRDPGGTSDGEDSVYGEGWTGLLTFERVALDGQENGVFAPIGATGMGVLIDQCVFGRNRANGNNDGRSHDIYVCGASLTVTSSVFCGTSRGNTIKSRSPKVSVSNSYVGRTNGRWIDLPGNTAFTSQGNTYVTEVGAGSGNAIGVFDEGDMTNPGPSSWVSTGDAFYFSRAQEVIWNNDPNLTLQFVNPVLKWIGKPGDTPPVLSLTGNITGLRQLTADDRVDAAPPIPADPAMV